MIEDPKKTGSPREGGEAETVPVREPDEGSIDLSAHLTKGTEPPPRRTPELDLSVRLTASDPPDSPDKTLEE